ncbi:7271_t:CDS:2, partial [Cetraspora pellucida]
SFATKQHPRISPDFANVNANPIELLSNFKKNVRHKIAHGIIIDEKGRWSDLDLQNVAHLAC